jgi:hypothetical protein
MLETYKLVHQTGLSYPAVAEDNDLIIRLRLVYERRCIRLELYTCLEKNLLPDAMTLVHYPPL